MISLNILIIMCSVQINITLPLSSIYAVVQLLSHVRLFATLNCSTPGFSLEKAMAPHSSTLVWKIPWMEEPGRLQSMGLLRVGHDWATSISLSFTGEGNGNPLQCSCLENPRGGGAWWAAVYGVTQSRTRLKWLSSSRLLLPPLSSLVCPT